MSTGHLAFICVRLKEGHNTLWEIQTDQTINVKYFHQKKNKCMGENKNSILLI